VAVIIYTASANLGLPTASYSLISSIFHIWASEFNPWDNISYMCTLVWLLNENRSAGISKCVRQLKCQWVCLKRWWTCTSHINLLGFYLVLLQLLQFNYVQHASTSTSYLCPPRGSMFVFCYYSLGGNTAMPGGLYVRLCHAFLVSVVIKHNAKNHLTTVVIHCTCGNKHKPWSPSEHSIAWTTPDYWLLQQTWKGPKNHVLDGSSYESHVDLIINKYIC